MQLLHLRPSLLMYLKSLEIQGFKSFANKTVLLFHEGVTGIVGPNGSGKSNIADAVRWVLGEQKVKSLRGASMQDVIFAGTQMRKPQGFAFVAITLDNSDKVLPVDYAEVTVSRRLYRSGESEYMINGQAVRLKDVQELFYDTGIGREGYSIIGQGQIDAILNGRPEERRGLFDEAAGIVKFKRRKQIAEKKLESVRSDLVRITDILKELENQVEPLRKQSEAAREYLKLREELKLCELNLFVRESDEILGKIEGIEEKRRIAAGELETARKESDALKADYETLDRSLSELDRIIAEKTEARGKAELLKSNLEHQISLSRAQIETEERNAEELLDRLSAVRTDISEKEALGRTYYVSLSALSDQLILMKDKAAEGGADLPLSELSSVLSRIGKLRERVSVLLGLDREEEEALLNGGLSQTGGSGSGFPEDPSNAANHSDQTDGGASDSAEDPDHYEEPDWLKEIRGKQSALAGISDKEARVAAWLAKSREEKTEAEAEVKRLNRLLSDRQQAYHTAASRRDSLRNIAERYEGYGQSIRRVMEVRDRVRGIHGVVADLIRTKKEYEVAVETALGGSIQNIVTDSEETAKILIEHLKKNRFGRATFLPLSAIHPGSRKDYEAARREAGIIGFASELTEVKEEYQELNEYLLGRCLVADSMDHAIAAARKFRHSLKIVTLEGELLSPGGSISGGAYKNSSNLIGRQREIGDLEAEMKRILRDVDGINQKIVEAEKALSEKAEEEKDLSEELREIGLEKNSLALGIMSEMKLQYSGLSQKTDFLSENIERLSGELLRETEEKESLLRRRSKSLRTAEEKKKEIEELSGHIVHVEGEEKSLLSEITAEQEKKEALSSDRSSFFAKREELSSRIMNLEKELLRVENQKEKEEQRFDERTEYIWNEYELSQSSARAFYQEEIGTMAELRSRANAAKASIRSLGPVNVQALEDYKTVSERYEFMRTQHADLTESEGSVLQIIEELDAGMKKQFAEKFAEIRREFDQVFKLLFGGGQGSIELVREEGEDVLSAGISIIAQPPGKKLQNMMQLSGGEKALTAIALLFAIQNLKPSPFCLLDEIEAALDDSNVSRFAQYLHKLTEHTQFILVTHRRGTMEAADRLYGVTMQEKGVTALVSVDLVSDQLEN